MNAHSQTSTLRRGFTTGTSAAAAAVAAFLMCRNKHAPDSVAVCLPGGNCLDIPIAELDGCSAAVIKDAGDDPDVTDKALIRVRLSSDAAADPRDHIESRGKGTLIIRGGNGVGTVTRPGLDVPPGKWAVNPGPRRIIADNLALHGFGLEIESLLLEISVPDGERIAARTLNPTLGVTGGISILGNSGYVEPFSNDAYIQTIRLQINSAAAVDNSIIGLSTGGRSIDSLRRDCPGLHDRNSFRIGDFIAESLLAASRAAVRHIFLACMPGKLYKYACGYHNTHAHKVKMDMTLLLELLTPFQLGEHVLESIRRCQTIGEAASYLEPALFNSILEQLASLASTQLRLHAPDSMLTIMLYDSDGSLILKNTSAEKS